MRACDTGCAHNLQAAWLSDTCASSTPLFLDYFCNETPVWRRACAGRKTKQSNAHYLSVLRNLSTLATHALPTFDRNAATSWAYTWAADLPVVAIQFCADLGYYTGLESMDNFGLSQQYALSDMYASATNSDSITLVLRRQDSVHLVLHLLDVSLRCGYIDPSDLLCCLRNTVSVMSCTNRKDKRKVESLWLALVNITGATVSRYSTLTNDGLSAALDITFQTVQSISIFSAQTQSAVLALVFVLSTSNKSTSMDRLITQLVSECISAKQTHLLLSTGQLLLRVFAHPSNRTLRLGSAKGIYALMSDINSPRVRDVWRKVACLVDNQILAPSAHPFAAQRHALRNDYDGILQSHGEVVKLAYSISTDDAMLVVKLVAESLANHSAELGDLGLSNPAINAIVSIACDLWQKPVVESNGAYAVIDAMVLAAGLKIRTADIQDATAVTSYLVKTIAEAVGKLDNTNTGCNGLDGSAQSTPNDPAIRCGLFWVLEIMFHLCQPGGPASLLLKPTSSVETLLCASRLCGHYSFGLFVFQTAVCDGTESQAKEIGSTKRLVRSAGLHHAAALLNNEVSDAVQLAIAYSVDLVADATDALYGLSLADIPSGSGAVSARLANYDEFDEHKESLCLVASDHLLGHTLARTTQRMVLPDFGATPFRIEAMAKLDSKEEASGNQKMQALGYLFGHGYVSAAMSLALATNQQLVGCIGEDDDEAKVGWTRLFTASRISADYFQCATASPLLAVSRDRPSTLLSLIPKCETDGDNGIPDFTPYIRRLYELPMPGSVTVDIEELATSHLPDTAKAKEALLYYGCTYDGLSSSMQNALFTSVLLDHVDRIRFTPTGVFDPVAKFVSIMATRPTDTPQLAAPVLNANAVGKLASYIPQLFAMLCASGDGDSSASVGAFSILESIAACNPDLVVFYAVVAKNSLPGTSSGSKYAAKLLQRFDGEQVADIEAFVDMTSSVAVLPQENLRWISLKAKSAHLKAVTRYQQGRFGVAPARTDEASAAILEPLKPALQVLEEYNERLPQSSAEQDFCGNVPRLKLLFQQLCFSDSFSQDDAQLMLGLEQIWNEIFKTLATATTLPLGYVSTRLARFTAPVPIPVLTNPAEPVYFSQTSSTVRVIGSKTRPKLITLYLSAKTGEVRKEKYILKGSEDLRIDESTMQMFIRMNKVASSTFPVDDSPGTETGDVAVSSLSVYNVVPLGTYGGLIQVIDNAPSLFQIYSQHSARSSPPEDSRTHQNGRADVVTSDSGATNRDTGVYGDQSSAEPTDEPMAQRSMQNRTKLPPIGFQQVYMGMAQDILKDAKVTPAVPFEKWPASVASKVYDTVSRTVPADLLYRHLLRSAQSPGHLYLLTKSMVRSISMSSIAGYVLGLGDRHLDNLLVDVRRGCLVQIDFNVCYDFGGVSHVPETVPFRMTPILSYICGTPDQISHNTSALPFAYSRIFMNALSASMLFCRMDRDALVNALTRRMLFQPFKEWAIVEEAHLRDHHNQQHKQQNGDSAGEQEEEDIVAKVIRRTAICPPNAFWRLGSGRTNHGSFASPTELEYGWRIAQAAVRRVDARLDYQGHSTNSIGKSIDALVEEQVLMVWEAAASKERLARMYIGWAPWV